MSPLLGRDALIASIAERLVSPTIRLLTLTGPGGIGKTRLALELAAATGGTFRDGVAILRFASVSDPAMVPVAIARALNIRAPESERAWAMAHDRESLLVLDNFEQLMAAAPGLVDVLTRCPDVTMLVTSRQPLVVTGEHEYPVPPLSTPEDDAAVDPATLGGIDAVRLFVQRAAAVRPDFRLTHDNAAAVAQISRTLDGLPLAIELAAARINQLSPQAMMERLETASDLLQGGPKDRAPHQRSLRETIAWSYDLLDHDGQQAFRRLAIFAGGFLAPAAAYVCGLSDDLPAVDRPEGVHRADIAILDICRSLVDTNLIYKSGEDESEPRFAMLRTIRSFARETLQRSGERDDVAERHAAWYLAFARVAEVGLAGPSRGTWLDRLDTELPNLRLALEWHHAHDEPVSLAVICRALGMFWILHGHIAEGSRWIGTVLAEERSLDAEPTLVMDLHCLAGWLAVRRGDLDGARARAESSLAAAYDNGSPPEQVSAALRLLGEIEDRKTNYTEAEALHREALALYRAAGNQYGIADVTTALGGLALDNGAYDEAVRCFQEATEAATLTGDSNLLARVIDALSVTLHVRGDTPEALACAERALALFRADGDVRGIAVATDHVGKCSRSLGDIERAWASHRESLAWRRRFGDPRGMAVWLEAVAGVLVGGRSFATAARVLGAVTAFREQGGIPRHNHEAVQLEPVERETRRRLSPAAFAREWARGQEMSLAETVELAQAAAERVAPPHPNDEPAASEDVATGVFTGYGLTARELEIVELMAQRLPDRAIAERLSISPRTVNSHVSRIFLKMGVHTRGELIQLAGTNRDEGGDSLTTARE
jgi:predicted ATPase/DNA-binding CsgD family transcriptional regulator/tetratricopeptide (TPR) repeat protein